MAFVIATAWGTLGDTLPFIAVAAELRRRGHEVAHALAAGIPQIILPIVGEQFDLGYRVERLGVGRMLTPAAPTAAHPAREIGALVASAKVRSRCEHHRGEMDPLAGASLAAEWIEALVARALPRAS